MVEANRRVPRAKNMMFMQYAEFATFESTEELEKRIRGLKPKQFAIVFHDRDVNDHGVPVGGHWHAMMTFDNARSTRVVASALGEPEQFVEAWRGDRRNGFAYLCHRTDNSRGKFQYDPKDVVANFDYVEELATWESGVVAARSGVDIDSLLDALLEGHVSLEKLKGQLSGSQWSKHHRRIQAVWDERLGREAKEWRRSMHEEGRHSRTFWITGRAGQGKTSMAKAICVQESGGGNYYMSGSTRDLFQDYEGEHHIILDELSPKALPFADMKRVLDPYAVTDNLQAPSRFRDKHFMPELIVVTSPFDPHELYKRQVEDRDLDSFGQLLRRLTLVLELTDDKIRTLEFDPSRREFLPVPGLEVHNPYSAKSRGETSKTTQADAFGAFTEQLGLE